MGGRKKILVIDDNLDAMGFFNSLQKEDVIDFSIETDPNIAIKRVKEESFSCVLIDIRMRNIKGFEIAKRIYDYGLSTPIPIIFVTGELTSESFSEAERELGGLHPIISKKDDIKVFLKKLEVLIAQKEAYEDRIRKERKEFKSLFENAPIALWDEDLSKTLIAADKLASEVGVDNLEKYLNENPEVSMELAKSVIINHVNNKTLMIYKAKREELIENLPKTFNANSFIIFNKEIVALVKRQEYFEAISETVTLDGGIVDTVIYINFPVETKNYKNVIIGMIDVSEIKRYKDSLSYNSKKYSMLLKSTGTAYVILNEEGIILEASEEFSTILGEDTIETLVGRNPRAWISKDSIEDYDKAWNRVTIGEEVCHNIFSIKSKNNYIWIDVSQGLIRNGDKKVMWMVRSASQQKDEEQKAFIAQQKKKDVIKQNILEIRKQLLKMQIRERGM